MLTELGGVCVMVNGKPAYVYFLCSAATSAVCAADQINALLPPGVPKAVASIVVESGSTTAAQFYVTATAATPPFLQFGATRHAAATHADYRLIGPVTLYPDVSTPARPGETVVVWDAGFGLPTTPITAAIPNQRDGSGGRAEGGTTR